VILVLQAAVHHVSAPVACNSHLMRIILPGSLLYNVWVYCWTWALWIGLESVGQRRQAVLQCWIVEQMTTAYHCHMRLTH